MLIVVLEGTIISPFLLFLKKGFIVINTTSDSLADLANPEYHCQGVVHRMVSSQHGTHAPSQR